MDTKKIGAFLKQCRKEKNLTQEQLAEKFGVSARTVSRWETGSNMPDLSILVDQCRSYYHTAPICSKTSSGAGRNVNCFGGRNCICVSYGT